MTALSEANVIHYEWRNQPERCIIGGKDCSFKSQIERKWALYLQMLLDLGAIDFWDYETTTFEFEERHRIKRQYTPDFEVRETIEHGLKQTVFHEVKTSLRQTDIRRFRLMAADFPNETMVLILPSCRKGHQSILRGKALKYVARVVYANPIFKKMGIK